MAEILSHLDVTLLFSLAAFCTVRLLLCRRFAYLFVHTQGEVLFTLPGYTDEESDRIYEQLLYLLCSPGHIGTMFQATSTNDITFWVLHPTVDRCVRGSGEPPTQE